MKKKLSDSPQPSRQPLSATSSGSSALRDYLWFLGCLLTVFLFLFYPAFHPDKVQFSNDAPLGVYAAQWMALPGAFGGLWHDLNSIGNYAGPASVIFSNLVRWALDPLWYSKIYPPITLLFLGSCAWLFFRCLNLNRIACTLGGLAVALSSSYFSASCWGVGTTVVGIGYAYLALAAIVSGEVRHRLVKLILAGFAVGMGIMEGFDMGVLFSLLIAAFTFFQPFATGLSLGRGILNGAARVALVAICAAFMAAHALSVLVGTQIQGVVGTQQDAQTRQENWNKATQWSLPKKETLRLIIPGVFGYRMDTPEGLSESLQQHFRGGVYWGTAGHDAAWEEYFKSGRQSPAPDPSLHFLRHSGGGNYVGTLVAFLAAWTILQSLRKKDSIFQRNERSFVWFWTAVAIISLLLAYGRFAPFYQFFYALPYFSTIRIPAKFLHLVSFAVSILFAYGVNALIRRYAENAIPMKNWWAKATTFDKGWMLGTLGVFLACVIGWRVYAASSARLMDYLETVLLGGPFAAEIARFSAKEVGWFIFFFAAAIAVTFLILRHTFAGGRARWAGVLLGLVLVADLGRSNLPWIIYWDYKQKYETNGPNAVLQLLRQNAHEHRVSQLPFRILSAFNLPDQVMQAERRLNGPGSLYEIEWKQHLFPYYDIQTLDIVQMPRFPEDLAAYEMALGVRSVETLRNISRRWELTNTRYLLGFSGFLELANTHFDPQSRFRVLQRFDLVPKPGVLNPTRWEQMTAEISPQGTYAVFEFTGALPRAGLYSHWQVNTNDQEVLEQLTASSFDPGKTLFVSTQINETPATEAETSTVKPAEFVSYKPKHITLKAETASPAILLLNDKHHPDWKVLVDGKPAELLRCNFIMRGVYLTPGTHTVEFLFRPSMTGFYISLAAILLGLPMLGFLACSAFRTNMRPTKQSPASVTT